MKEEAKTTPAETDCCSEKTELRTSRRDFLKVGLGVTVAAAAGTLSTGCLPDDSNNDDGWRVRRNVVSMSAAERDELVQSILYLKSIQSPFEPSLSYYDQFVHFHQLGVNRGRLKLGYSIAHQCPAFLPWHRKLVLLFENAVRAHVNPDFALPYWDWTEDSSLDTVFSDDFMGPYIGDENDSYALTTGPFRKGQFSVNLTASSIGSDDEESQCPFPFITRGPKFVDLPTATEVDALLQVMQYDSSPYDLSADTSTSFRNYLLGISPFQLHSVPHVWLGGSWDATIWTGLFEESTTTFVGTMSALDCSPNDPCFWLHHCNTDRIWAMWETLYGASFQAKNCRLTKVS